MMASTYFVNDRAEIEEIKADLKRFWEIEDMTVMQTGIMGGETYGTTREAKNTEEKSFLYENGMYRVAVP